MTLRLACKLVTVPLLVALLACGGGGGGSTPGTSGGATAVTVTTATPQLSLAPNGTVQLHATVSGSSNTGLTWTTTGGLIDATGTYTAPAVEGTYRVVATSVADPAKSATITITVVAAPTVAVSVNPTSASLTTNGTQTFTATVMGNANTGVTWSTTGGSITAGGVYTAPATAGTYSVTATSVADTSKKATATVTVTAPQAVAVSLNPTATSLTTGGTQTFTATVTGTANTAVTWSTTGGSVTAGGMYTAPATAGTYSVTATSVADGTKKATATVTVTAPQIVAVSVNPTSASLMTNATQTFTATVTGTANTAVTWSTTGGSITAGGVYTAPATAGTYSVTATSVADATKKATATVTVSTPATGQVQVVVAPTTVDIGAGKTTLFSAAVSGNANTAVTWSVDGGAANGTITAQGLFTAPASLPGSTEGPVTVRATSVADPSRSGTATANLKWWTPDAVTVAVNPTSANVFFGKTQTFTALVAGTANTAVTWTASAGTITSAGLYTAPNAPATVTVTATSVADSTKKATASVTVGPDPAQGVTVQITPGSAALQVGKTQTFTASVFNAANTGVTWTATGGTITAAGLYTAPATAGTYTVKATSQQDATRSATATVTVTTAPAAGSQRVIGYYTAWSAYERKFFARNLDATKLSHLNYAFANVNPDGSVVLGDPAADAGIGGWSPSGTPGGNFAELNALKAAHPNLKTLLSIGGWTWSANFPNAAATDANRKRFASTAISLMKTYGFDGLDIDWEYPVGGGLQAGTAADTVNFTLLMTELRTQLTAQGTLDGGRHYLLTAAMGIGAAEKGYYELKKVEAQLDWFNLMSYDFYGSFSPITGFNAPLYPDPNAPTGANDPGFSVSEGVQAFLAAGVAPKNITLGLAMYGRSFAGVGATNGGLYQPFQGAGPGTWEAGVLDYADILQNYVGKGDWSLSYHPTAKVPMLYSATKKVWFSYEDPTSLGLKCDYLLNLGLGGGMFWELSEDFQNSLLKTVNDKLNNGAVPNP